MKKLNKFLHFDWEAFAKDKEFRFAGNTRDWVDNNTSGRNGTTFDSVIFVDNTDYGDAPNESTTNLYEKIAVKTRKNINIPLNAVIQLKGVTATVYGEYRNMLSVIAEDVVVISK